MKRDDNAILQHYYHIATSIWQVIQVLEPSVILDKLLHGIDKLHVDASVYPAVY